MFAIDKIEVKSRECVVSVNLRIDANVRLL